jgi:hypothetical protein
LNHADLKGDINTLYDLQFYVGEANARHNLFNAPDGFTPFEMLTGQPPQTVLSLNKIVVDPPLQPITGVNAAFIQRIKATTADMITLSHQVRDEQVRRNVLTRDSKAASSKGRTLDVRVGEKVSYKLDGAVTLRYTHYEKKFHTQ